MANKPKEFPIFSKVDKDTVNYFAEKLKKLLGNLSSVIGVDSTEIILSGEVFIDIVDRIEKRRVYFYIFYDGCDMGELNEGALFCFWIVKLHPFFHPKIQSNELNAKIAICLFLNAIYYYSGKTKKGRRIHKQFVEDLYYSLRYRDISKESLMIIAESFIIDNPINTF